MTDGRLFDADVHCAPATPEALFPYLPRQWAEFMRNTGFAGPGPVETTYPSWAETVATDGRELTLPRLQTTVLAGASHALLHCYYGVEAFTHPYYGPALATAVNRWLAEEWLDRDDRLFGAAVITPQHVPAAVEEIERVAADRRFVSVLVPARATAPYGDQRYWPIWEAAAAHGLAVGIAFGGATGTPPTPVGWLSSYWEEYVAAILAFQSHVASLAVSGLFDRRPELRVVVHESGWTWLPGLCLRLDQEWRALHREVPWMDGAPSTYVRRFMRFSTQPVDAPDDPVQLRQVIDQLGLERLLVHSSDHPHRYGSGNETLFDVLSDEEAERVRWRNADECYGLSGRLGAVTAPA